MIKIQVNQTDLNRITQRFQNLARNLAPAVRQSLAQEAGTIVTDWIRYGLLSGQVLKARTGRLRDSVKSIATGQGVRIYQDAAEAPYGRFHEFGVPHPWRIAPRDPRGVLRFNAGGREVFARYVTHPGLPARPFLSRGIREKFPIAMRTVEKAMKKAIRASG